MQFLSPEFFASLAVLFTLYWIVPKRNWQNFLLLGASLGLLYYLSIPAFLVLIVSTALEWSIARKLGATNSQKGRFILLWVSILLNFSQLAFFKYSQFFLPEVSRLFSMVGFKTGTLHILMPIGISFWTLQKMTLTLDVFYRRRQPEKSLIQCLLFTSFFPTLPSGPIESSRNLIPQFETVRTWNTRLFSEGIWLFSIGAFLKAVVADNVAQCVDTLLAPGQKGVAILLGMWAYGIQIYGDFAGYSYMARGCARVLGINVTQNFMAPYLSRNLSDFWKRWHASLSGWLNEFIFMPISMRLRRWKTWSILIAIWVTFIMSGLWHGTGLTFFVYGCLHAMGLTVFILTKNFRKQIRSRFKNQAWLDSGAAIFTFNYVCIAYLFFRAPNVLTAMKQVAAIFEPFWNPTALSLDWTMLILSAFAVFGLQWQEWRSQTVFWIFDRGIWLRVAFYLLLGFVLLRFYAPSDSFIYFQF